MIRDLVAFLRSGPPAWLGALGSRAPQLRLALRLVVAGAVALAVAEALALPQGYWSVITAIIVIQSNVGGSLKAAGDRLLATCLGAMVGLFAVSVIRRDSLWGEAGAFLLAVVPTAMASALNPAFRIAPVTAVILILSVRTTLSPIEFGVERIVEIALGGIIGLGVSLLVLPARAHRDLRGALQNALVQMAEVLAPMVAGLTGGRDDIRVRLQHRRVRATLIKAETLADEARRERVARLTEERDPDELVAAVRRLYTDLLLLGRATVRPLPEPVAARLVAEVTAASSDLRADMEGVAAALAMHGPLPDLADVDTALRLIDQSLTSLRAEGMTRELSAEQIQDLFALAFAFGQFRRDLTELHARVAGHADSRPGA
jgi:uncharacterized membrane protein YccC